MMKKKQKDNLIKAFEEINAPDKDVLLQKIESKKAFGGEYVEESKAVQKTARKKRAVWTSLACSFVVIALVIILISSSIFGPAHSDGDGTDLGVNVVDYRGDWNFYYDNKICFDTIDKTMKDAGVELIYDYDKEWSIIETQITQDESGYREYYVKDGKSVEVTVLLQENVTNNDARYFAIFSNINGSSIHGNYRVYQSYYFSDSVRKDVYIVYLEKQVYIFVTDFDIK